jgi:hypothetical protein
MPQFIADDVRAASGSTSDEPVELIIGVDGDVDGLADSLTSLGASVDKQIGRTTLRAHVPKNKIEAVCDHERVISVEYEKRDIHTLAGNGQ